MKKRFYVFSVGIILFILGAFFANFYSRNDCIFLEYGAKYLPYTTIYVQGKPFNLLVDLGATGDMYIYTDRLETLNKGFERKVTVRDIFGNEYEEARYIVQDISFGKVHLDNCSARSIQRQPYPHEEVKVSSELICEKAENKALSSRDGELGRGVLSKFNLLFDCSNSKLYFIKSFEQALRKGLISKKPICLPLKDKGKSPIIVDVNTEIGCLSFLLDTGASVSFISSSCFETPPKQGSLQELNSFTIEGKSFGPQKCAILKIDENASFKGVLGMDFFNKHKILIDWEKQELYID